MSLEKRLSELVHALTNPPYYLIRPPQSSPASWQEASAEAYLLEALSLSAEDQPPKKLVSTKVRLNANATLADDQVTRYSRSSLALEPHTDSSNQRTPHSIVIFGMSRPDRSGGLTQLISVDEIVAALDEQTKALLSKRVWPIGQTPKAILDNHPVHGLTISYYKKQVERMLELGASLSPEQETALRQLDHCIESLSRKAPIPLKAGETAIINNHKVLHGRTALSQDTRRLMFRYRLRVNFEDIQRLLDRPREIRMPSIERTADRCCHMLESQGRTAQLNLIGTWAGLSTQSRPQASKDGPLLFKQGKFSEAKTALEASLEREPQHFTSNYLLSAIATRAKDSDTAKTYLTAAALAQPFRGRSRSDDPRPTILKLRSFEGARVAPKKMSNGRYTTRLKGAQISTKYFIDKEKFQLVLGNMSPLSARNIEPPKCDLIFNGISDIDASPGAWKTVSDLVDQWTDIPIINRPQFLSNTTRDAVARICNSIDGLNAGVTKRYESMVLMDPAKLANDLESEFDYPMLTRSVGTHTGATLQKSDTRAELLNALHQLDNQRELYVSQYVDCRSDDGSFQKIRCFFVDGVPHPVCNIRSLHWEIRNRSRYLATSSNKEWIDEEAYSMEHFADYMGKDRLSALSALHKRINLDLFGVDFALLPSGEILVFEANVAMRHNYDYVELAPQIKPAHDRVGEAFNKMVASRLKLTRT